MRRLRQHHHQGAARLPLPLLSHPPTFWSRGVLLPCRVLYGQMHVCSYDWFEPDAGEAAMGLPREARRVVDSELTAADQPTVLFPHAGGNIHEFTAVTDCAVLDLMSPPYSTGVRHHCPRALHGTPSCLALAVLALGPSCLVDRMVQQLLLHPQTLPQLPARLAGAQGAGAAGCQLL